MTMTMQNQDVGGALEEISKRLYKVEQLATSPAVMGTNPNAVFNSVTIDGILLDGPATPPTALVLSSGTYLSNSYVDASWTASSTAHEYQVELARDLGGGNWQITRQQRTVAPTLRMDNLDPNTAYGVRVYALNRLGVPSVALPAAMFQAVVTGQDATIPGGLGGFAVTAGVRSIVAVWAASTDLDVKNGSGQYELEIATNVGFTTGNRSKFFGGTVGGFTDLTSQTMYWARVRSVDSSGNAGPWTAGASVSTSAVATGDFAGNTIDASVIADLTILGAKIASATISDAKIISLTVDKVSAGTIAAKDYVLGAGGQIKTASLAPGLLINSQGISLYNSSGVRTVYLDALTGNGTFSGIITGSTITGGLFQTATVGQRFKMSTAPFNGLEMFSGLASSKAGRLIAIPWSADTSRPLIRLEGERTAGASTAPTVDLIGGGTDGYGRIELAATDIILNGTSNYIRYVGSERVNIDANGMHLYTMIAMRDNDLRFRGWNDINHRIRWLSPDQLAYDTFVAHKFYVNGSLLGEFRGSWLRVQVSETLIYNSSNAQGILTNANSDLTNENEGGGVFIWKRNNGGGWGTMGIRTENGYAGFAWHRPGTEAHEMYANGANLTIFRNDGAYSPVYCDVIDMSSEGSKYSMRAMAAEEDGLSKIKKLKPIRFKRNGNAPAKAKWEDELDKTRRKIPKRRVFQFNGEQVSEDHPKVVAYKKMTKDQQNSLPPKDQISESEDTSDARWDALTVEEIQNIEASRDADWMGLTAEELALVYPEAVHFGIDGKPSGIRYRMLTIPLLLAVQQLDLRVAALEAV